MTIIETCPKCGHDLRNVVINTYPPIQKKECVSCDWIWEQKTEEVIRVPFNPNINSYYKIYHPFQSTYVNYNTYCSHCSNNPANGGSGFCNCILGTQVTC